MPITSFFLISAGVGALLLGGMVLWYGRRAEFRPEAGAIPTRLATGFLLLVLGYHLMVWAFPARWTPLQWPRERWYWLLLGIAGLLVLSRGLDRLEGKRLGSDTKDGPRG